MLAGYLPFHSSSGNKQELCSKIMEGRYTSPEWMSPQAKDLLSRWAEQSIGCILGHMLSGWLGLHNVCHCTRC